MDTLKIKGQDVDFLLKTCREHGNEDILEFILSLCAQYAGNGYISPKQYEALQKIFDRIEIP